MRILLLEDEDHLRENITLYLSLRGHEVDSFENGEELLEGANANDYDCMILDINTPLIDGFEVLEYIRTQSITTPAIFISALTDIQRVLKGFELGAEDYLKKPFDLAELEVRIHKVRPKRHTHSLIEFDDERSYDIESRTLYFQESVVKLSATQKRLLYLLIKNQNSLVTFEMLLDYVWENKDISHATILSTMRDLKRHLPKDAIKNVKSQGYIFEIR